MQRLLVTSDYHCGHRVGLTPPDFNPKSAMDMKGYDTRAWLWDWFQEEIEKLRPFDIHVNNGDAVDGPGGKTGGSEELYVDRNMQTDMAAYIMNFVGAPMRYITYGTGYHVGEQEDWELTVAKLCNAVADTILNIDVGGLVFNLKHHIGGSQSVLGRQTPLVRERLWNLMWAEHGEYPKAGVVVRSHVHYFDFAGGYKWLAMSTPALQAYGSKFARRISGTVDIGFVYFDVNDQGGYTWDTRILKRTFKIPIVVPKLTAVAEASPTATSPIGSIKRALRLAKTSGDHTKK